MVDPQDIALRDSLREIERDGADATTHVYDTRVRFEVWEELSCAVGNGALGEVRMEFVP